MTNITIMKENEINRVANFIAELNNHEASHIGYCGKDKAEIAAYIKEDIPVHNFVCLYDQERLVGVLGGEPDEESGFVEIWGPFVLTEHKDSLEKMWKKFQGTLPPEIHTIYLFQNKENKMVCDFATNQGFTKTSEEVILNFSRKKVDLLKNASINELTPELYEAMKTLHDHTFPGTYYSGKQILQQQNDNRRVFVITEKEELCGYIYVEAEPEFGDGSIEFFAVNEKKRGRGIGQKLLQSALKWIFSFESIESVTLCVNSNNTNALKLYKKVGFEWQHNLYAYVKKVR